MGNRFNNLKKITEIFLVITLVIATVLSTGITVKAAVTPWSKNASGQFVDSKGNVITGATMKGIDVSKYDGTIDWKKVAASDVDYAIIKCGSGDDITSQDDPKWAENVKGCEDNNIPFGVYIYSYAGDTGSKVDSSLTNVINQAKSEANHVLRLIKGHTINFPIYYDIEETFQSKFPEATLTAMINTFCNAIHTAGYECGVYANLNWWNNYISSTVSGNALWYKWVAQWADKCTYTSSYQMWQATNMGKVDGIYYDPNAKEHVDINFWFGKVRTRSYNAKIYPLTTVAAPKPVTAPKRVTIKSLKKGKKKATIKWKKVSGAKGYRLQYSTSKKFTSKTTKNKYITKTSKVVKKLKSKKKYYFRVKAYKINTTTKKKVYSKKWSKVKKVTVK